jgi:AraC-like DNA-binding protein
MKNSASFISKQISSGDYYYLNLNPRQGAKEVVVCGGREECAPEYRIERNNFKFCSIEFVSAGKGTLTLRGASSPLRPGTLFFYAPGIPHIIESDPESPMIKHFIDFAGSGLLAMVQTTGLYRMPLYASNILRIRTIYETLQQTGGNESRHRQALCILLLKQLILTVDESALPQQEAFSPAWQTYLRCRQHIEQNFPRIGNIELAAQECHLDQAYLTRLFKRYADETPLQLLTRLKMGRAADMLSTQKFLIKQVAEKCGYPDPYLMSDRTS